MKILIVCEHASTKFGGEAMLPINYFKILSKLGHEVYLITHSRVKRELDHDDNLIHSRIYYIPDTFLHVFLHKLDGFLPHRIGLVSTGAILHLLTQIYQWIIAKSVIKEHGIQVIHEPAPVSPIQPSIMFGLGVPVVIGPLNGAMDFPPFFRGKVSYVERAAYGLVRWLSNLANLMIPGKYFADVILVANKRTLQSLPRFRRGTVIEMVENGVFSLGNEKISKVDNEFNVLYVGRLIDLKCVDVLIEAVSESKIDNLVLHIVGDGPERPRLEKIGTELLGDRIRFHGFVEFAKVSEFYKSADIFVLPSIRECGGAVVLEAMSYGLAVVAANWGGPSDYIDDGSGVLIDVVTRNQMVSDISFRLNRLWADPVLRAEIGGKARARVENYFMWDKKVVDMLKVYNTVIEK